MINEFNYNVIIVEDTPSEPGYIVTVRGNGYRWGCKVEKE